VEGGPTFFLPARSIVAWSGTIPLLFAMAGLFDREPVVLSFGFLGHFFAPNTGAQTACCDRCEESIEPWRIRR
jgi:hypothetical protein